MNRREFLAQATTGAAVASAAALTAMAAVSAALRPDAALSVAWGNYCNALMAYRNAGFDISDEENDRLDAVLTQCEDAMDALPALSLEGVAIKMLYQLARGTEDGDLSNAIIAGDAIKDAAGADWRDRADLALIRDVRAMAGGLSHGHRS